jgi:nucleoside-diphosphate-sugar epimerase
MKAFVTGGAGFLGQRVVDRLLRQGHSVRCLVRSRAAADMLKDTLTTDICGLEFAFGSLQDLPERSHVLSGCDVVYHIAAAVKGSPSTLFLDTVVGTRSLLTALKGQPVRRVVLVSSLAVYGTYEMPARSEIDETCDTDVKPHLRDPYTYSKIVQERVCREAVATDQLPLVIVRPGVIYGPGRPSLMGRVGLSVGPLVVKLGGGDRVPCTYVENCADAVYLAGVVPAIEGRTFNILDDDRPTRGEVIKAYRRRGDRLRVIPVPTSLVRPAAAAFEWYWERSERLLPPVFTKYRAALWKPLRYSNARVKRELGWRPTVGGQQAIEATFTAVSGRTAS